MQTAHKAPEAGYALPPPGGQPQQATHDPNLLGRGPALGVTRLDGSGNLELATGTQWHLQDDFKTLMEKWSWVYTDCQILFAQK